MSNIVRDINIKKTQISLFDDIKEFDPNNVKLDKKSYKTILICYIAYVTTLHCLFATLHFLFATLHKFILKKLIFFLKNYGLKSEI